MSADHSEAGGVAVTITSGRLEQLDDAAAHLRAAILLLEGETDQDAADRVGLVLKVIEVRRDILRAEAAS